MPEANGQIRRNCRVTELQLHLKTFREGSGFVTQRFTLSPSRNHRDV